MTLSGWTRLWIVGAVIWWGGGAFVLIPQFPSVNDMAQAVLDICSSPKRAMSFVDCDMFEAMQGNALRQAWWDLSPYLALWIVVPVVVWVGLRWIAEGFAPDPLKNPPAETRSDPFDF